MHIIARTVVLLAAVALPVVAQAQNFSAASTQEPLYPYSTGSSSASARVYPYVSTYPQAKAQPRRAARPVVEERNLTPEEQAVAEDRIARRRKVGPTRHDLVDELKRRAGKGRTIVINEKPRVIERRHVVDVPVVIERRRYVDIPGDQRPDGDDDVRTHAVPARPHIIEVPQRPKRGRSDGETRIIRADAEIRITGDDQMSIKLYRKGRGPSASAD